MLSKKQEMTVFETVIIYNLGIRRKPGVPTARALGM